MSSVRAGQPGATRLCPHCKATVLESATICPGCRHHLRFNGGKELAAEAYTSFSVDGSIAHRERDEACEYCIVLQVTNERGEQILRQIVGVGALQPGEKRRLNVTVDMLPLVAAAVSRSATAASPGSPAVSATTRDAPRPALAPRAGGSGSTPAAKPPPAAPAAPHSSASVSAGKGLPSGVRSSAAPGPTAVPAKPSEKSSPAAAPVPSTPRGREPTTRNPPPPDPGAGPGATLGQRLRIFRKP